MGEGKSGGSLSWDLNKLTVEELIINMFSQKRLVSKNPSKFFSIDESSDRLSLEIIAIKAFQLVQKSLDRCSA